MGGKYFNDSLRSKATPFFLQNSPSSFEGEQSPILPRNAYGSHFRAYSGTFILLSYGLSENTSDFQYMCTEMKDDLLPRG